MYFYYQKKFDGSWSPVKSPEKPDNKKAEGVKVKITNPILLPSPEDQFDLDSLAAVYPAPEVS